MTPTDTRTLADAVSNADKTAVARALNLVEDRREGSRAAVAALLGHLDRASRDAAGHRIGLTGPPGVGKSSLAATLARAIRQRGRTIGVVAVDPTSLHSGGSLLGDRARMGFDPSDRGVFVRSLATAGEAGGLAYAANAAVQVLAAAYDVVVVETTGVGQSETDVVHVADTVALVIQPGSGDVLQFLKAGIMEIPDVLVVNKADHEALAQRTVHDLQGALESTRAVGAQAAASARWEVPIVATSALDGRGIEALADALEAHHATLGTEGLHARRRHGEIVWTLQMLRRRHGEHAVATLDGPAALRRQIATDLEAPGASAVAVSEALGQRYLQRIRGG